MSSGEPSPHNLQEQLEELRGRLDEMAERLARLESHVQPPVARSAPPREEEPATLSEAEIIDASLVERPVDERPPQTPEGQESAPPTGEPSGLGDQLAAATEHMRGQATDAAERFGSQWEELVGGRWLTWAGALTLIVAVAFFVPWAWTELNLPDWSKVLMLHGLGVGLLVGAWLLHRRELKVFAQGLAGLGIFTLYASAWAAQHLYGIYGEYGELITFIEGVAITAIAVAAAVSASSVAIILLGALGGYLTPIIASSGGSNHIALFTYLAFLNVALIASAVLRSWSFLKPLALVATALMFAAWLEGDFVPADDTWSTQWLLSVHAIIFLAGTTIPPVVWQQRSHWLDLAALSANSLWFVGTTWLLFHERPEQQLALVCWGMTLLHLVLFAATYQRVTNVDRMPRVQLALAAVFFILATPLQLEDSLEYLALAWSAQGAAITMVGIFFRDRQMCVTALIIYGLAVLRLAVDYDSPPELVGPLDRRFLMFLLSALLFIVGGALYPLLGRALASTGNLPVPGDRLDKDEPIFWQPVGGALMAAGNLLAMIGLTCQWDSRLVLLIWTLDAAAIWAAGFVLRRPEVRTYGFLLGVLLVGGRILYHGDAIDTPPVPCWNDRFGTLLLVAVVYFAAAWAYRRLHLSERAWEHGGLSEGALDPVLAVLANVVLVAALSLEVDTWFQLAAERGYQPFSNMRMAEQATFSILWAVYAAAAVVAGLLLRWPTLRYVGLVGLALTLAKVFFVDLAQLRLLPRVLALAVLGIMLLAVSFLYQKFRARMQASAE